MKGEALITLQGELGNSWKVIEEHHLVKSFAFRNFQEALAFTNRVGNLAETEGHHPDLHLAWEKSESKSGPTRSTAFRKVISSLLQR